MDYFVSNFNIFLEDNGEHYVYNTMDARLVCVSKELYHYLKSTGLGSPKMM
jgi:hypothetical protein